MMRPLPAFAFMILLLGQVTACKSPETLSLDVQGHRGLRGFLPENSIPGFLKAMEIGVKTLEMDVVITRDSQVVVSHEPFLSGDLCRREGAIPISKNSERNFNIYRMEYAEVRKFDCGSNGNKDFPYQKKITAYKPLLTQAIDSVERHAKARSLPAPLYNVEIKSAVATDNLYHPAPAEYAEQVIRALQRKGVLARSTIQSFDIRPLKYIRAKYPQVQVSLLVDNNQTPEQNLAALGFAPNVYSPRYQLVDARLMRLAREKKIRIIPWTVNEPADIEKMMALGVDGMISDYPNRVLSRSQPGKFRKKA
jgi:glycerophosphoryl diester phosphodiesterase